MRPLHTPSWLPLRRRAEAASAGLPDLIAAAERAAAAVQSGEHRQRKPGMGERFWQFRDYDPADRPQDIDWRQSAKGDRIFVRQREWQTTQSMLFWVQGDKGMDFRSAPALPDKRSEAVVLALALSLLLTRHGELTGLLDGAHRPGRSDAALQTLSEDLMRPSGDALPHPELHRIPAHAGLVMIGDFLADIQAVHATVDGLAARVANGFMLQVLDPAELALPFSGRMIFEEPVGGRDHHVMHVDSIRDGYRQRIEAHNRALRELCRQHRWRWLTHRSGDDMTATLFKAWHIIAGEHGRTDT